MPNAARRIDDLSCPQFHLVAKLKERIKNDPQDPLIDDFAKILFGYALIAEGSELDEPQDFNQALLHVVGKAI